ncbi:hypothetical protein [Methylorubrum sp. SB2]|uniref:hypothetical protein n=1 Tax=Methylorubrum subtropicum TaxID=3138812 RepID=UPI00313E11E1
MKTLVAAATALALMGAAPAMAMSCCGGSKGKAAMCAKGDMKGRTAMNMKGKGCCCEGMSSGRMSSRRS